MSAYSCSACGAEAFYDGRCGDGPVLMCGCDRRGSVWVPDRCGGYYTNPSGAVPVKDDDNRSWAAEAERRYWENDRR